MISRRAKYATPLFVLLLGVASAPAIEGQNPTPRFFPPDFSVEEERVTYPGDLLEFFRLPFVEYLRADADRAVFAPDLAVNSSSEGLGDMRFSSDGYFAELSGHLRYFGDDDYRQSIRSVHGATGYGDFFMDRYPVGVVAEGQYSAFRGEYEPSTYHIDVGGEGHVPIGKSLLSLSLNAGRDNWKQMPGPFARIEPDDRFRTTISNVIKGEAAFRSIPGELTGVEIVAGGVQSIRYEEDIWELRRNVASGKLSLIYDSRPLRIAIGGAAHRTWEKMLISPHMDFDILWRTFEASAELGGYIVPLDRWRTLPSPRVDLPRDADFLEVPISVEAGCRIELKPGQILAAKALYSRAKNEPVIWNPNAEAPSVSLEETKHQRFSISLSSDFGMLTNVLHGHFLRDYASDEHIPIEPTEIVSDTVSLVFSDFEIFASGYREYGQPYLVKPQANNIALGIKYRYKFAHFEIIAENVLGESIFDREALEFTGDTKLWARVSFSF